MNVARFSGLAVSCGVILVAAARAQDAEPASQSAPDPRAIVQRAADAIARLQVVSYELDHKVSGFFQAFFPNLSGTVMMGKESSDRAKRFFCRLKIQRPDSSETTEVTAGADGETYFLIDEKTKTVHADIDPQVLGKHRDAIDFTIPREFGMVKPFEDALRGGEIRYVREEKVEGHDCHVVHFKSSFTAPAMDWYFSKEDFLPRRTRFAMNDPQMGEGGGEVTIRNLKVDPKLDKDPFALTVPAGYKQTDEFAP